MQIMGAVAREYGFDGPFLTQLTDPLIGLHAGCGYLQALKSRWFDRYGWGGVLSAWNTGSPSPSPAAQAYLARIRLAGFSPEETS
jgi:Transglycosylase SLT domain.